MGGVLIIKMNALGDIVIASPHIEAICEHHKKEEIRLLTSRIGAGLFKAHPRAQTIVFDRNKWFGENSFRGVVKQIKKIDLHVVYDLQGNRISRKFVKKINSPRSVGTQPESVYTHHPVEPYTRDMGINVFDRLDETLISGGLGPAKRFGQNYIGNDSLEKVNNFAIKFGLINGNYFCMHAGSASDWPSKRWPKENFLAIAKKLKDRGLEVVWVGSKEDQPVNKWLSGHIGIDATGLFSPVEVCALAKNAASALANDSGPMHLFAAANISVFGFFGPTSPQRSHALCQRDRVFYNHSPCSPCFSGKCKKGKNHMCLALYSPQTVWKKIEAEI